jgi:hypothetical protein
MANILSLVDMLVHLLLEFLSRRVATPDFIVDFLVESFSLNASSLNFSARESSTTKTEIAKMGGLGRHGTPRARMAHLRTGGLEIFQCKYASRARRRRNSDSRSPIVRKIYSV